MKAGLVINTTSKDKVWVPILKATAICMPFVIAFVAWVVVETVVNREYRLSASEKIKSNRDDVRTIDDRLDKITEALWEVKAMLLRVEAEIKKR